jgi:putative flippase GtrA
MESPAATAAPLTQQPGSGVPTADTAAPGAALRRQPATKHYSGILRFPAVRQLLRFTGVGIVCTVTSLALYTLLRPWLGPQLANAAALIITSVMNTALNRRLTFKIAGRGKIARDHLSGLVVIVIALVITGGSLGVLHWLNPDATMSDELWTTTLSGFLATAVRFALLRHWIFRRARHR